MSVHYGVVAFQRVLWSSVTIIRQNTAVSLTPTAQLDLKFRSFDPKLTPYIVEWVRKCKLHIKRERFNSCVVRHTVCLVTSLRKSYYRFVLPQTGWTAHQTTRCWIKKFQKSVSRP